MKAALYARFGPPEALQVGQAPRAKEALIRVHAATVCQEDPDMRAAPGFNGLLKPSHPILGQEPAGELARSLGASRVVADTREDFTRLAGPSAYQPGAQPGRRLRV